MVGDIDRRRLLGQVGRVTRASTSSPRHALLRDNENLIDVSQGCIAAGQRCLEHCIAKIQAGDLSVTDALLPIQEMLALSKTVSQYATFKSRHLRRLVGIYMMVCSDCEEQCAKRRAQNAAFADCAQACGAAIRESLNHLSKEGD